MTTAAVTVTATRMGRPSLNVEETKVRLGAGMKARIVALVGKHRMAMFIREAVQEKLDREEGRKSVDRS